MKFSFLIILGGYSILLSAGQTLFKIAGSRVSSTSGGWHFIKSLIANPNFIAGCVLYGFATIAWVALLSKFKLSFAYPIATGLTILITVLSGVFLFDEQLSTHSLIGILIITVGVITLSQAAQ